MVKKLESSVILARPLNGVVNDKIYYAITGGTLASNRMQLAATYNDAIARRPITGLSNVVANLKL